MCKRAQVYISAAFSQESPERARHCRHAGCLSLPPANRRLQHVAWSYIYQLGTDLNVDKAFLRYPDAQIPTGGPVKSKILQRRLLPLCHLLGMGFGIVLDLMENWSLNSISLFACYHVAHPGPGPSRECLQPSLPCAFRGRGDNLLAHVANDTLDPGRMSSSSLRKPRAAMSTKGFHGKSPEAQKFRSPTHWSDVSGSRISSGVTSCLANDASSGRRYCSPVADAAKKTPACSASWRGRTAQLQASKQHRP
ncbi:hypothetical protein BD289DRAFT_182260 [Coniella lustricola]|uniref:Uncharacterized protein n=1 Tax=Coniella lustricola TaxID=2025994 RepID=A0A2T2ZTC0_9PEZI|nr:hypothetical protein BD289DRAFT_182260 [Coniella lustricola]